MCWYICFSKQVKKQFSWFSLHAGLVRSWYWSAYINLGEFALVKMKCKKNMVRSFLFKPSFKCIIIIIIIFFFKPTICWLQMLHWSFIYHLCQMGPKYSNNATELGLDTKHSLGFEWLSSSVWHCLRADPGVLAFQLWN